MRSRKRTSVVLAAVWLVFLCASTPHAGGYHGRHWSAKYRCGQGWHNGGYHHGHGHDDWVGAIAVGLGVGLLSAWVFSQPSAAYARPAPRRVLVCEPPTYTVHRRVHPRTGRFYWLQEPTPRRCWYEYRP